MKNKIKAIVMAVTALVCGCQEPIEEPQQKPEYYILLEEVDGSDETNLDTKGISSLSLHLYANAGGTTLTATLMRNNAKYAGQEGTVDWTWVDSPTIISVNRTKGTGIDTPSNSNLVKPTGSGNATLTIQAKVETMTNPVAEKAIPVTVVKSNSEWSLQLQDSKGNQVNEISLDLANNSKGIAYTAVLMHNGSKFTNSPSGNNEYDAYSISWSMASTSIATSSASSTNNNTSSTVKPVAKGSTTLSLQAKFANAATTVASLLVPITVSDSDEWEIVVEGVTEMYAGATSTNLKVYKKNSSGKTDITSSSTISTSSSNFSATRSGSTITLKSTKAASDCLGNKTINVSCDGKSTTHTVNVISDFKYVTIDGSVTRNSGNIDVTCLLPIDSRSYTSASGSALIYKEGNVTENISSITVYLQDGTNINGLTSGYCSFRINGLSTGVASYTGDMTSGDESYIWVNYLGENVFDDIFAWYH